MPEAMSDPKAFEMMFPQYRSAVRVPSSLRLYHFEMRKSAPGKNAASTKPRKKRVRSAPMKLTAAQAGQISTYKGYESLTFDVQTHLSVIPVDMVTKTR